MLLQLFFILISVNTKVPLIFHKILAKYTKQCWRNGLKCQGQHNFFRVDVNFQTVIVTQLHYRFFFIFISINIKVRLILQTKFQPNISSRSGGNSYLISFAIFSDDDHLEFSTRLNFATLKPWSLIMQHMKFKIHGCSTCSLRE